ncbi:MAG TPA: hypothetical protein PK324_01075 [Nocardioides sp.]|uniref:hypothetical protein n=1 Tax=uncultured Nocardioides sp. TaxID=198441 RepID=UPI00261BF8E4|nr:hypothetical protein [uncultured Nocardioides sp.]HRD59978.1 hypothetical protein [Nocardioides sp.]HRK44198.1 hypothetical protein [Nocardioides sp.]
MPGVLAILPAYASIEDPVAELRAACLDAVSWLGREVTVLADDQGTRIAAHLLDVTDQAHDEPSYLVVANGSATRTEKAPGHFDARAEAFDRELGHSLRAGRPDVDAVLADELWASVGALSAMRELSPLGPAQVDYDAAPFGVQYWVMRWTGTQ